MHESTFFTTSPAGVTHPLRFHPAIQPPTPKHVYLESVRITTSRDAQSSSSYPPPPSQPRPSSSSP